MEEANRRLIISVCAPMERAYQTTDCVGAVAARARDCKLKIANFKFEAEEGGFAAQLVISSKRDFNEITAGSLSDYKFIRFGAIRSGEQNACSHVEKYGILSAVING